MSSRIGSTLATGLVVASLAGALGAVSAAAASDTKSSAVPAYRLHRAVRLDHFARRSFGPVHGYSAPAPHAATFGYNGPRRIDGYVYLPGRGILDEACDLPTSACPNGERDVQ